MTTLTTSAPLAEDASLRPVPWRRMAWVTWRQHRTALIGVAVLLSGLALCLWVVGLHLHRAHAAATACRPANSIACAELVRNFNGVGGFLADGVLLQTVPALIGAFVGAPILAQEFEAGTYRYAWTQGFGGWRWTLAKLVALGAVVAAAAGLISVLASWYYQPYFDAGDQSLSLTQMNPLTPGLFDLRGVAFAAWTLAAFAIGGLAGILVRRVVPAMVATLAAYAVLAVAAAMFLREHYLTPLVTRNPAMWASPGSAWIVSRQWKTKGGQSVSLSVLGHVIEGTQFAGKGGVPKALAPVQYLVQHGYTLRTSFQPVRRFWPFQWIEGGWLMALSILLIAASVWLVRRRAV